MRPHDRVVRLLVVTAALLLGGGAASGPVKTIEEQVEFLASDRLEGRMTGSEGERLAADYLAERLREIGAIPLPGAQDFRLPFEFTAGTNDIGSSLTVLSSGEADPESWTGTDRVRALSFSENGRVTASVVFAGYGLTLPESRELSYDSFFGLDVKDKIVVVLRYSPEDAEGEMRAELSRYSGLRYKALQARDRGAKALVVVSGPRSPHAGETIESTFDTALSGSGIVAASVGGEVAERIFRSVEGGLEQVQAGLDTGNPHVRGFEIPDLTLSLEVKIERERRTGRNVVGYLPPPPAVGPEEPGGVVVLGAHYDHLGRGKHGNSRAGKDEEGGIHHGADDNASGVAAVLAAGRELSADSGPRGVVLAFWTGEELGLLGSSDFVKNGPLPVARILAYLNFDMVGRMKDGLLNLQGAGSSGAWARLIEQTNVVVGLDVRTQDDPYLPTDASVLYQAGVPVLSFFTGSHDDYHRPTDVAGKINYEGLREIARFAAVLAGKVGRLETPPQHLVVARRSESTESRDSVRAYTGTIPDYASEVEGLRLSGVIEGGPADLAGIEGGDVIIEFAGRAIKNIYDYTYALDAVKADQEVRIVCTRGGERLEFTITPRARP